MNKKIINGLLIAAAVAASGAANASIAGPTLLNFNKGNPGTPTVASTVGNLGMQQSAYSGFANLAPTVAGAVTDTVGTFGTPSYIAGGVLKPVGSCVHEGSQGCYYEDGLVLGIVQDTSDTVSHLHREGTSAGPNTSLKYHSDSSGVYVRALDSTMFSLTSMDFSAPIGAENPIYGANAAPDEFGIMQPDNSGVLGANEYWEILAYASALNPGLDTAVDSGAYTARQIVTNGFSGLVTLGSAFQNIGAFWIHYHGYQQSPKDGYAFGMQLDNVLVGAAIAAPAAVPLPAGVWLFGSGLMGLLYSAKRKAIRLAA